MIVRELGLLLRDVAVWATRRTTRLPRPVREMRTTA